MKCISCEGRYDGDDAGTCKQCHEDHKAKVAFLTTTHPSSFSDIFLFASDDEEAAGPVPAHKAVLVSRSPVLRAMLENEMEESRSGTIKIGEVSYGALAIQKLYSWNNLARFIFSSLVSRSPVFNAMLENEMEESLSGTIKIRDVSYPTLRAFVNYLYTTEVACLDQQLACDLLVMAEKYQVHHLKDLCQKFLVANLNWENSFSIYTFVHQHNAKKIIDAALTLIIDNMDKLTAREEYAELKEKDPQLVFEIYEAYLSKQVNKAAAQKGSSASYPPKFNWGGMYIGDYEEPPE
ncbi:hypothetical protein L3X38_008095 [Prunus dulcis]|uniref:BTB domain-containing protein n=1 Tax=Prunus dulcis TaxID=3755 RepID=A0AAD4ZVU9_PRUDU|nr:hypothetical protein L3X38_008095 [Prunus dulcis]